jgi:sulfur carrier protein
MEFTINGKSVTLERPITVAEFLEARGLNAKMIVVEHNGEILRREAFGDVMLRAGDQVEIVQMMAGG